MRNFSQEKQLFCPYLSSNNDLKLPDIEPMREKSFGSQPNWYSNISFSSDVSSDILPKFTKSKIELPIFQKFNAK